MTALAAAGCTPPPSEPARSLDHCGTILLIVYNIPQDAAARGYLDFLRTEDNPFFNTISGLMHYANWKVDEVIAGQSPDWRYFDFFGLDPRADLEDVWFNPELDAFRANWIDRWGYGDAATDPPEMLLYAYSMMQSATEPFPKDRAILSFGKGRSGATPRFVLGDAIKKHFSRYNRTNDRYWRTPMDCFNPIGLDWVDLGSRPDASFTLRTSRIAGPD